MFTVQKVHDFQSLKLSNVCDQQNNIIFEVGTKPSSVPNRVWVIPGHVFYSSNDGLRLVSYPTYENFQRTNSILEPTLALSFQHAVIELCIPALPNDNVLLIVTQNGDVHVWKFDFYELEWCKQFTFKLSSGNNDSNLQAATFHEKLEFAVWCEKHGSGVFEHSIYIRKYSPNAPNSISDFCLNDFISETILTHCPLVEFCTLGALVTMRLIMQCSPNMFMVWSKESGLSMFDTNGTVLWTDNSSPYKRFAKILTCTLNSWNNNQKNSVIGQAANKVQERLHILTENCNILSFNSASNLCSKTSLHVEKVLTDILGFFVYSNFVCLFTSTEMLMFDSTSGNPLGTLCLTKHSPLLQSWYKSTNVSVFGMYNENSIYRIVPKDLPNLFSTLNHKLVNSLDDPNLDFIFKINSIIQGKLVPVLEMTRSANPSLQSKALVLALLHHCNQLSLPGRETFDQRAIEQLVNTLPEAHNLKLKRLFRPLIDCFLKLHSYSNQQLVYTGIQ